MPFDFDFDFDFDGPAASAAPTGLDHKAAALARYAKFLRDSANNVLPNVTAYTGIFTGKHQELEQALQDLLFYRVLPNAFGAHLDNLGEIVGQPRAGMDDTTYRLYITARIKVNLSSGTSEDVIGVVALIIPSVALILTNYYPASFELLADAQIDQTTATALGLFVQQAKAAGVRGIFIYMLCPVSNVFQCDTVGQGLDQGLLAGTIG